MTEDRISKLEKKIAELTGEIAALKEKSAPEKPFVPRAPSPPRDWTEGMTAGAGLKPMVDLIPDPPNKGGFNAHAWSQTHMGSPGGFGPPPGGGADVPNKSKRDDEYKVPQPPPSYWSK